MTTHSSETPSPTACKFLSFRIGAEEYGIDILRVQEIRGFTAPTRIANAPRFMLGVLNLRGTIVPIFDMRLKFGADAPRYDGGTVTIVLTIGTRTSAMVVDSVSDVVELRPDDIRPPPDVVGHIDGNHVFGLGTLRQPDGRESMLILLDIEALMLSADMQHLDGSAASTVSSSHEASITP